MKNGRVLVGIMKPVWLCGITAYFRLETELIKAPASPPAQKRQNEMSSHACITLQPFSHINEHFNRLQLSVERVERISLSNQSCPRENSNYIRKKHSVSISVVKERQISNILSPNSV